LAAGFQIIELPCGEKTLRSLERNETYHPGIGPLPEARALHVEQQRLKIRCAQPGKFVLWDVGLGAAANAVAALNAFAGSVADVEVHSFDRTIAPLEFALSEPEALPYLQPYRGAVAELLQTGAVRVSARVRWHFHRGDFREQVLRTDLPAPNSIFYDPYSPATNCEMWTLPHFENLYRQTMRGPDCFLTTYSRSTAVRVGLLLAGFYVGVGCVIGEKDETTIAANRPGLIERPLGRKFFDKVKVSRNGSPFRDLKHSVVPISTEDYARLAEHPQFRR
jgi:hypothetical protein